jgi:hypothetical protein
MSQKYVKHLTPTPLGLGDLHVAMLLATCFSSSRVIGATSFSFMTAKNFCGKDFKTFP